MIVRVLTHESSSLKRAKFATIGAVKIRVLTQKATQGLDPMLACQQPNIGSGATAIGSAGRAPDE